MPRYRVVLEESTAYEMEISAPSPEWASRAALELDESQLRYLEPLYRDRRVQVQEEKEEP
jgi:hypothetical protein